MPTVADIMNTKVLTVQMDDTLELARDLLDRVSLHHVVVTDGRKVVGIVSEGDLLRAVSPKLGITSKTNTILQTEIQSIMSPHPVTVTLETDIKHAAQLLVQHSIGCLPVTDGQKLQGLVTWKNLMANILQQSA